MPYSNKSIFTFHVLLSSFDLFLNHLSGVPGFFLSFSWWLVFSGMGISIAEFSTVLTLPWGLKVHTVYIGRLIYLSRAVLLYASSGLDLPLRSISWQQALFSEKNNKIVCYLVVHWYVLSFLQLTPKHLNSTPSDNIGSDTKRLYVLLVVPWYKSLKAQSLNKYNWCTCIGL